MGIINDLQFQHAERISRLISHAFQLGYRVTFGCARCAKIGHHMPGSLHYIGLATDLNLFVRGPNGKWHYTGRTEDHLPLGEFWELLGGAWGGRWGDGNHYSTPYGGKK